MSPALFPSDGLVNDIQREFWGPEAIKRWADRETVGGDVVTTKFLEVKDHYRGFIVSAVVDGDYDKTGLADPPVLTFSFSLAGDRISWLIVWGNKPGY